MSYASVNQLKAYLGIRNSDTFTADAGTDTLTLTDMATTWATGDEVVVSTTAADLPAPLAINTVYYVIYATPLTIQLATTAANATAGTEINITDAGTGTHTISSAVTDDDLLEDLIDRAQAAIDALTGNVFEAATETRYYESDAVDGHILFVDRDLLTVTTLTNGDDDATVIPSTEYWLIDRNVGPPYYGIRLESNSTYTWEFGVDGWVSVAGTWGYSATAPNDIVQACIRWAAWLYHLKDAPVYETTIFPESGAMVVPRGLPSDIVEALKPYRTVMGVR